MFLQFATFRCSVATSCCPLFLRAPKYVGMPADLRSSLTVSLSLSYLEPSVFSAPPRRTGFRHDVPQCMHASSVNAPSAQILRPDLPICSEKQSMGPGPVTWKRQPNSDASDCRATAAATSEPNAEAHLFCSISSKIADIGLVLHLQKRQAIKTAPAAKAVSGSQAHA